MSSPTTVLILYTGQADVQRIQVWLVLQRPERYRPLNEVTDDTLNNPYQDEIMSGHMLMGCYDYFPRNQFLKFLREEQRSIFHIPESVQVLYKGDNEDKAEVHEIYTPPTAKQINAARCREMGEVPPNA
jgi:hypothetical protein